MPDWLRKIEPRQAGDQSGSGPHGAQSEPLGDRLGHFVRRRFFLGDPQSAAERGLRWSVMLNVLLTGAVLVLGSALGAMIPLQREVPYFVQLADDTRSVVAIRRMTESHPAVEIVAEKLAIRYVAVRHELRPDTVEMNRRWGTSCLEQPIAATDSLCAHVYKHSSPQVYDTFQVEIGDPQVVRLIEQGVTRRMLVDEGSRFVGSRKTSTGVTVYDFEIRFELVDSHRAESGETVEIRRRPLLGYVSATFRSQRVKRSERLLNPWGFVVLSYEWTDRLS